MRKSFRYLLFITTVLLFITKCSLLQKEKKSPIAVVTTPVEKVEPIPVPEKQELDVAFIKEEKKDIFLDSEQENKWVDSTYSQMALDEKIGQLFMVAAYSNKDEIHFASIDKLIKDQKIGGLIFFQGGPMRQAKLTNRFQANSKIPLFIGIDAEWGLSMRLDSTYRYPYNMTLGAVKDLKLIERLGVEMGKESKRLGIHFNFAPVIDVNTNPLNPIIGNRSFGEDKNNVTNKAIALMKGMHTEGVIATGKHFPGHGDTSTDSHSSLPLLTFNRERLNEIELYPYKQMFAQGLQSVMVAHLSVPSLDARVGFPTSLSYNVVTDLLQKEMGFKGLIFTDALNMKGASNFKKPGEIDLEAFMAGNDILLFPEDVPTAIALITEKYKNQGITEERLAQSVKKILHYKYKVGLNQYAPISTTNLIKDLNSPVTDSLQYALYENAITLIKNQANLLPIKNLQQKIAYLKLGDDDNSAFVETLKKYTDIVEVEGSNSVDLNNKLSKFDLVIVGFHKTDKAWKKQDFSDADILLLSEIAKKNKVILDVFAKPYTLSKINSFPDIESILVSYQNNAIAQQVSAEALFGAIEIKGSLPVSINSYFPVNTVLKLESISRLGFSSPESVGMSSEKLAEIEVIANKTIFNKIAPGMQVLVARKGKVIYQKSFGFHTYDSVTKVQNTDIYDVASLTKMVSTLPNVMQQFDKKKVNLDTRLGEMLPQMVGTNKDSITFKELLSHNARLQAWIPFYKATLDSCGFPKDKYYSRTKTAEFSKQVSKELYLRNDYQDTIMKLITDSNLLDRKRYVYSDFTFILLKEYLEKETGKTLDQLSATTFFKPMGMNYTLYNPLQKFNTWQVPPTEVDTYFRYSILQGFVHDMAAAMQSGVAGHAGVFSNSMDVAKMMQLFLQKGEYGGERYFSADTFDVFNTCHFCAEGNRRGLGFDKSQFNGDTPTCGCVSVSSFGHTGFTGTYAWADPESQIVYVFLSNRTFPDSNAPNKLSREHIRENIQRIIQEAIIIK